jgi:hypothetical protein
MIGWLDQASRVDDDLFGRNAGSVEGRDHVLNRKRLCGLAARVEA